MSQRRKSSISFGPGASSLILIFVVLAMSVLGMLALMNSRNDAKMSSRSAQVTQGAYELNALMEERRAELDALLKKAGEENADDGAYLSAVADALPEDMTIRDRTVSWTELTAWAETNGLRQLACAVEIAPLGTAPRAEWTRHNLEAVTDEAVIALNARLEKTREVLTQNASGWAHTEKVVQVTSASESETPRALVGYLMPGDGEKPVWGRRYIKDVTDESVLALMDRADETRSSLEEALDQAVTEAMQRVFDKTVSEQVIVSVADVDAIYMDCLAHTELPDGVSRDGHLLTWQEKDGEITLRCAVELLPLAEGEEYTAWISRALEDHR
jgi:hypothetical protein